MQTHPFHIVLIVANLMDGNNETRGRKDIWWDCVGKTLLIFEVRCMSEIDDFVIEKKVK